MSSILRVIETDEYRLIHRKLETGEQYFTEGSEDSPHIIRTEKARETFTPYSVIMAYSKIKEHMVFLTAGGITIVESKPTVASVSTMVNPKVFLLKTTIKDRLSNYPIPLVAVDATPVMIREISDRIRIVAAEQRLLSLADLSIVLKNFTATVEKTALQSTQELHHTDIAFTELVQKLASTSSSPTSVALMRSKLDSYNTLITLIDKLLEQKQVIERLTYDIHLTSTELKRKGN